MIDKVTKTSLASFTHPAFHLGMNSASAECPVVMRRASSSILNSQLDLSGVSGHPSVNCPTAEAFTFYEFFAGGGMARAGLGPSWKCLFGNDIDALKAKIYRENWGNPDELRVCDVKAVDPTALQGQADLAWASFPCQDLSLAGSGAGLEGERSGTFHSFWKVVRDLISDGRGPKIVALENVCGLLTSRRGLDFNTICAAFAAAGFRFGAVVVDASMFLPQSRPRLFLIGVSYHLSIPPSLLSAHSGLPFHSLGLTKAYRALCEKVREQWVWWSLPTPPLRNSTFADLIEEHPTDVNWHTQEETNRLLMSMSATNWDKVERTKATGRQVVGCIYRRTRREGSERIVRAEVRFDDTAGCLRTPKGGSSRQTIIIVHGESVKTRLMSARETARLMGLPDSYKLPHSYNRACHLTGDGVAVPVVRYLAEHLMEPILAANTEVAADEDALHVPGSNRNHVS